MKIAFLTNIPTNIAGSGGGYVHASQVAKRLINRGHILYTNLQNESDQFIKFASRDFFRKGKEIDAFYIRIDGWSGRDELTLLRQSNPFAPCIWEINAPLEEMRTSGISEKSLLKFNNRRKKLARMVDVAICVSDEMEEYAREYLGIRSTFVIPNGSDPDLFNPAKRDNNIYDKTKYKVLYSGSFKYKWQDLKTIQSLAKKLKEEKYNDVLIIVTAEGESSDNLLYLGYVQYGEIPRFIASADVGLCLYENYDFYKKFYYSPTKFYDYMASGLPVIGTNAGQIKLVIDENQNGLLTDNSIEDLIEKIMLLKNNPDIASEMGLRGRKAVIKKYNWDNVVLQTESILLEAIEKHKILLNNQPKWRSAITNFNSKVVRPLQQYYKSSKHILSKAKSIIIR
ncbi:MAG: glycosyltransferase [bacterium]